MFSQNGVCVVLQRIEFDKILDIKQTRSLHRDKELFDALEQEFPTFCTYFINICSTLWTNNNK